MERTHAELEGQHYREVEKNPLYAAEGMMDVRLEEMAMNMPIPQEFPEIIIPQQEPWERKQWYKVEQLKGEMLNLKGKFLDLERLVTSKGYKSKY